MINAADIKEYTLSVVIPCYNEAKTIAGIAARVQASPVKNKEIIIVDNCSDDGTRDILKNEIEPLGVKVLYNEENMGKGYSVRRGIAAATGDLTVIQDADYEYDPQEYPLLLAPLLRGEADAVYGSRLLRGDNPDFGNKGANIFLTRLSNLFTGLSLTDMETCYKAFRTPLLQKIDLTENDFGFEPEVTAKAAAAGARFAEVAISYKPRTAAEGKKVKFKDGIRAVWCIVKHGFYKRAVKMK